MSETFNPLYRAKSKQSTEAAPPPAEPEKFDTTTPAVNTVVRRFTLNDMPRYSESLYPVLKGMFPHLHERMYGGWLRSWMEDNATFFICGNATVALAQMVNDPLDPRPTVTIKFCFGEPAEFEAMYREILRWAKDIGARYVRLEAENARDVSKLLKHPNTEMRTAAIFYMD